MGIFSKLLDLPKKIKGTSNSKPTTSTEGILYWSCSKCGTHNSLASFSCKDCGKNK